MLTYRNHSSMLALLAIVTFEIASATPFALTPRDRKTIVFDRNGEKVTVFAPDWPTCANDRKLTDTVLTNTHPNNVIVRPDCDSVINFICQAFDRQAAMPNRVQNMTNMHHTIGTCEGHMLFSWPSLPEGYYEDTYNCTTCVWGFQTITETCMLLDDPTVKNYASVGHQAGVLYAEHHSHPTPTQPEWSAQTYWGHLPVFMMGPVDYWGFVPGIDAADVGNDGRVPGRIYTEQWD